MEMTALSEFKAETDIYAGRIRLAWVWTTLSNERPGLRLLRRKRAYPGGPEDGLRVLDMAGLFRAPDQPWARSEQVRYLLPNSAAEGGLLQAEVTLYFQTASATEPAQVELAYYDMLMDRWQTVTIEEVSRLDQTEATTPPWDTVKTLEIFATPGGGQETSIGQIVVSTGHQDRLTPDRFEWIADGQPAVEIVFDRIETQQTTTNILAATMEMFQAQIETIQDGQPLRSIWLDESFNPDNGDWNRRLAVTDMSLEPQVIYYYALFAPDPANPSQFLTDQTWRAAATASGDYGLADQLYELLPALHKQYDEPLPDQQDEGQLRRFLQIFGLTMNQVRSLAEGLHARHDVLQVRADFLPHLARWIGWEPDRMTGALAQRNDILFAPELYSTVGTVPNIRALVNRVTGWDSQVKEFVHNIFLSNAAETIHLWEIWTQHFDGAAWSSPVPVTRTDGFDGRPAATLDGTNVPWLFWHADRGERREIWLQRQDGVDPTPVRAMLDAPDDAAILTYTDEYPAAVSDGPQVWLFWNSDRSGAWEIWARPYDSFPGGPAMQLTDHPAEDRHPTAVRDGSGQIWLFWQSNRRGPTDIWARVYDGANWGLPARITTAQHRHEMPSAAVDGTGRIWLFWSADLGDRYNLYCQIYEAGSWGPPEPVTKGQQRDEAPAAVFWNGQVWLFWHSNRDGHWQIWGRTHNGLSWDAPFPLTAQATADKEPAVVVDGSGELRLFWRSQRRGQQYQSRTIDTNDAEMLARLGTFEDRAHYTYDTGRDGQNDWYARDTVGLYVTEDPNDAALIIQERNPLEIIQRFLPIQVRAIFVVKPPA